MMQESGVLRLENSAIRCPAEPACELFGKTKPDENR